MHRLPILELIRASQGRALSGGLLRPPGTAGVPEALIAATLRTAVRIVRENTSLTGALSPQAAWLALAALEDD